MKKVRLVLACLITVACFSAFVISCKKSDNNNNSGSGGETTCHCEFGDYDEGIVFEETITLAEVSQTAHITFTSCAQYAHYLQYDLMYDFASCH